jgi:hypothetical protein
MVLSTFLQLSNVKQTQVCSAPAGRQVISTTLAAPQRNYDLSSVFENNADRLLEQKRNGETNIIKPICTGIYRKKYF